VSECTRELSKKCVRYRRRKGEKKRKEEEINEKR